MSCYDIEQQPHDDRAGTVNVTLLTDTSHSPLAR